MSLCIWFHRTMLQRLPLAQRLQNYDQRAQKFSFPPWISPGEKVFFTDEICQTTKTLLSSGSSRVHKSICREHKGTRSWTWIVWFGSIGYSLITHRIRNSYVTMDFVITTSPSVLAMINQ